MAITQTLKQSLSAELTSFLRSVIRQRSFLVKTGKSMKDKETMLQLIEKFKRYAESIYFNEIGSARFLVKHQHELLELIPGKQHASKIKLHDLVSKSENIIYPKLF